MTPYPDKFLDKLNQDMAKTFQQEKDENLCPMCGLYEVDLDDAHQCPFNKGLGGIHEDCNCCAMCTQACRDDI